MSANQIIERHASGCVEITTDGLYDVVDQSGNSLLDPFGGPFHTAEAAAATQRLLNAFDGVNKCLRDWRNEMSRLSPRSA